MRIVLVVVVAVALLLAATKVPLPLAPWLRTASVATPTAQPSLEWQLAVIQGKGSVDQQTLTRITYDLDTLDRECLEPRQMIADGAKAASDQLAKAGVNESISSILDAELRGADAAGGRSVQCNQLLAAYVVLREHGN